MPSRVGRRSSASGIENTVVEPSITAEKTIWPPVTNSSAPQAGSDRTRRVARRPLATSIAVSRFSPESTTSVPAGRSGTAGSRSAPPQPDSSTSTSPVERNRAIEETYEHGPPPGPEHDRDSGFP